MIIKYQTVKKSKQHILISDILYLFYYIFEP